MSGKGDDRRPLSVDEQTFSDNWDRVFAAKQDYYASVREKNYVDSLRLEGLVGRSSTVEPESLKFSDVRSNRTAPATHEVTHGNASEPSHEPVAQAAASSSTDREDGEGQGKISLIYWDPVSKREVSHDWWPNIEEPK